MPPPAIRTVGDLIFWQYAKIISDSAGLGKRNWGFIMNEFKQLQEGEIFWKEIRGYVKEREKGDECIFCGRKTTLTMDHLFPRSLNRLDDEKNIIWVSRNVTLQRVRRESMEHREPSARRNRTLGSLGIDRHQPERKTGIHHARNIRDELLSDAKVHRPRTRPTAQRSNSPNLRNSTPSRRPIKRLSKKLNLPLPFLKNK